jgi:hypothetical protein
MTQIGGVRAKVFAMVSLTSNEVWSPLTLTLTLTMALALALALTLTLTLALTLPHPASSGSVVSLSSVETRDVRPRTASLRSV